MTDCDRLDRITNRGTLVDGDEPAVLRKLVGLVVLEMERAGAVLVDEAQRRPIFGPERPDVQH